MSILETYLKEIHAKDYHGTDDNMPGDFERWLSELDVDEVIKYADELLGKQVEIINKLLKISGDTTEELKKLQQLAN